MNKLNNKIFTDQIFRKALVKESIIWFFKIYFPHYIKYPFADFHYEILKLLEDQKVKLICIVAFRGSGKSTFCSFLYPFWCALGKLNNKYIVVVCQTQIRAQETLINIRRELDSNRVLYKDFGPFQEIRDPNNNNEIILGRYGVKISAVSIGEGIRGTKFGAERPDVIICDDIEDVQSTKTKEVRDKTWQLVNSEIIPLGSAKTKIIFVGNLIHSDSVMMRLKKSIASDKVKGEFKRYPLLKSKGKPNWPGMYPTKSEIEDLKSKIGSEIDYQREYMLKIVPEGDQIVLPEWINTYQEFPKENFQFRIISVDPAFSQRSTADNTAIITASVFGQGKNKKMYIHPHPFNRRKNQPEVIEEIKRIYKSSGSYISTKILVENAGQQLGLIDSLKMESLPVEGITVGGSDKRARLSGASTYIRNGQIVFSNKEDEELINQILFFGTERYDDLVDAFTLAVQYFINKLTRPVPDIRFL